MKDNLFNNFILIGDIPETHVLFDAGVSKSSVQSFEDIYQALVNMLNSDVLSETIILINLEGFDLKELKAFTKFCNEKDSTVICLGGADSSVKNVQIYKDIRSFTDDFFEKQQRTIDYSLTDQEVNALLKEEF